MKESKKRQNIMSDIPYDDLCNLIALKVQSSSRNPNATPHSADCYLQATYKVILDQLKLNQRILIKDFGVFEIRERKSGERVINNPNKNNEKNLVYVEPRNSITFRAAKKFDVSVNEGNFKLATDEKIKNLGRKYRKKLKDRNNSTRKQYKNVGDLLRIAKKRKKED